MTTSLTDLPGGDLVTAGLRDLEHGRSTTAEALLVSAAATRLRDTGIAVPEDCGDPDASLVLYRTLAVEHGDDAHGRYLALLRQLESFARAAEHAARS